MKPPGLPSGDAVVPTAEGYDRWSAIYETDGNPLTLLEAPQVERLLGDVNDKTLLDVGCGTGRHALHYAEAGARVSAIDFSEGMGQNRRAEYEKSEQHQELAFRLGEFKDKAAPAAHKGSENQAAHEGGDEAVATDELRTRIRQKRYAENKILHRPLPALPQIAGQQAHDAALLP